MISLPQFKTLLGPLAQKLTDEQVECLRDMEYQFADAIFEKWLRERNSYPQGVPAIFIKSDIIVIEPNNLRPFCYLI